MVLVDNGAHSEHVQVIRCDIKPGSVSKTRDVESEPISGKGNGYTLRLYVSTTAMFS
jgi:hypothetical protein